MSLAITLIGGMLAGCAMVTGAARAYVESTPEGTRYREWGLRRSLSHEAFDAALASVSSRDKAAPRDKLLRSLYDGLVAFYAGEYQRSGVSLREANELAEDRYTKSLSRGVLAMVSNDLVLPYMPGHTERLLIPYYGAMGYLQRGDRPGAAVEARLLSGLLQQFEEEQDSADLSTRAILRYFAGTVFEAAGEHNDAEVAYRNARRLSPTAIPAAVRVPTGSGEVIIVLERGFAPNRVEDALHIEIGHAERDSLKDKADGAGSSKHRVFGALLKQLDESEERGVYWRSNGRRLNHGRGRDEGDYVLKVAWPVYERPVRGPAPVMLHTLRLDGDARSVSGTGVPIGFIGEVSEGIIADYRRQRGTLLARTVIRAFAKYAAAEAAEEKKGTGGKILAGVTGALLEHADTRSWHLLPSDISITRIALPAGRHRVSVQLVSSAPGEPGRMIDLGEVSVASGSLGFMTKRLWPDLTTRVAVSQHN